MTLGRSVQLEEKKRGHPVLRFFLILFVLVVLALATGVLGGVWWLRHAMRTSLPVLDGSIRVTGLSASVTVRRDQHGVPHIDAANLDDPFAEPGSLTARERLW